jgi:LPXTG-site transpeptidase (sortase) family protein
MEPITRNGRRRLWRGVGWLASCLLASCALVFSAVPLDTGLADQSRLPLSPVAQALPGIHSVDTRPGSTSSDRLLPSPPDPQSLDPGVIASLSIPRIGLDDVPIRERGTDGKGHMLIAPGYGVTHFASSARLGAGNAVLYGHDDIDGSVFANLAQLGPGDAVTVVVSGVSQTYAVTDRRIVLPTAVEILAPTHDIRLTLFTCWPDKVDTRRLVITAVQVPNARAAPARPPRTSLDLG